MYHTSQNKLQSSYTTDQAERLFRFSWNWTKLDEDVTAHTINWKQAELTFTSAGKNSPIPSWIERDASKRKKKNYVIPSRKSFRNRIYTTELGNRITLAPNIRTFISILNPKLADFSVLQTPHFKNELQVPIGAEQKFTMAIYNQLPNNQHIYDTLFLITLSWQFITQIPDAIVAQSLSDYLHKNAHNSIFFSFKWF